MSAFDIDTVTDLSAFKNAAKWLDSEQAAMVETVIAWAEVNSGTRNLMGIAAMEALIIALAAPLDAEISTIDLADGEAVAEDGSLNTISNGRILVLRKHADAPRQILLTGHLDTVFATDHPFQETTWLDGATLNGPGVADMKGGILVMLHALMALEQSDLAGRVGWQVMLSPDEETGSLASGQHLSEAAPKFDLGMTYEPALADGTLAGARKGSGNYSLVVKGLAAHAGRSFYDGKNAVVALSQMIVALAGLSGQREGLTLNPAVITGGVAPNVVPDLAICRFNVRLESQDDANWFEGQVQEIIAPWQTREGYDVMLHGGINRPPKEISPVNQAFMDFIAACGAALGLDVSYVATGGCCEGNNLAAAGLANVDTLGVRGGMIHSAQEFLIVESLAERAKLSTLILMAVAEGGFDHLLTRAKN